MPILISNSFPFSLVRRPLRVEPRTVADLLTAMHDTALALRMGA
jgi:hypothetical protein